MKTIDEMISVMQAYRDGKKIEIRFKTPIKGEWGSTSMPTWDWVRCDYRVKPDPQKKVVPYESAEEFLAAQKEHGMYLYACGQRHLPTLVDDCCVVTYSISGIIAHTYEEICDMYCFEDKTPCGKEVEV